MTIERYYFDVIFINEDNELKRVCIWGIDPEPNQYVWKHIPNIKEIDTSKYCSMRKFTREEFIGFSVSWKAEVLMNIIRVIKPINTYSIWCHEDSYF